MKWQQPNQEAGKSDGHGDADQEIDYSFDSQVKIAHCQGQTGRHDGPHQWRNELAPMITAGLLCTKPKVAMPAEKKISSQ